MAELQEYKCPCCGGAIAFDSTIQKMKCPYCDTEYEMETLAAYDAELKDEKEVSIHWNKPQNQWENGETDGLLTYVCRSCGGEIVGDQTTAAMSCPYCDNPVVMMGQLSGSLKPDLVIPFKLDKKAAKAALTRHYGGKKLLPKVFSDQNHIDEVRGSTFRSGCSMPMRMQRCATRRPMSVTGATAGMTTRKLPVTPSPAQDLWDFPRFPWTDPQKWRTS